MKVTRLLVYFILAASCVAFYTGLAASRTFPGYPLDDAWIHQTYARNWAETGQLAYVAGLPSAGSTAPLWTFLLSVAYRLKIDPYMWSIVLGIVCLAISAWLLSRLADRLLPNRPVVSWLTGLACVLEWHLIWAAASGMEALLFIALALALIDRLWAGASGWIIGILGGLLILTRPDGLLLFVLALGALHASRRSGRAALLEIGKAVLAFLIVLAPGAYFNLQAGGSIFPNTFYAKQSEYGELMSTLPIWVNSIGNMLIAPLAGGGLLLIPGVVWWIVASLRGFMLGGAQRSRSMATMQSSPSQEIASSHGEASDSPPSTSADTLRVRRLPLRTLTGSAPLSGVAMTFSEWLPLVWVAAHVAVYALRLPVSYQHGRYLLPIIPILLLYGVVGTALLLDWLKARSANPVARLLRQVYALVVVVLFILYVPIGAAAFATDVAIINGEMVAAAQWLDRNTPPGALIAAHDIGAIGYFARRPILDLAGLISPEVIPFIRDEAKLGQWIRSRGAHYLVTFPGWYPQLSASPDLVKLFRGDSAFSPEHMTVYALGR
jgi:hypothetical protein